MSASTSTRHRFECRACEFWTNDHASIVEHEHHIHGLRLPDRTPVQLIWAAAQPDIQSITDHVENHSDPKVLVEAIDSLTDMLLVMKRRIRKAADL